jgi:hypothetical protein
LTVHATSREPLSSSIPKDRRRRLVRIRCNDFEVTRRAQRNQSVSRSSSGVPPAGSCAYSEYPLDLYSAVQIRRGVDEMINSGEQRSCSPSLRPITCRTLSDNGKTERKNKPDHICVLSIRRPTPGNYECFNCPATAPEHAAATEGDFCCSLDGRPSYLLTLNSF